MNQAKMADWRGVLFATGASGWSILIRLLVGLVVFFPEGIQKLVFSDILGAAVFSVSAFRTRTSWVRSWAWSKPSAAR
jgi:hypothetical protein